MEAEWYVDPLGRFDGRFFDGETWTSQVSDAGTLRTDPKWDLEVNRQVTARATRYMTGRERRQGGDRRDEEAGVTANRRSGERRQLDAMMVPSSSRR